MATGGVGGGAAGGDRVVYPPLTGTNYVSWSIQVQAIMEDQGLWEVMEPAAGTSTTPLTVAQTKLDKKARAHLLQCLPDDLLMQVARRRPGKRSGIRLRKDLSARLQTLKREFEALRMKEEESVDSYSGKLSGMAVRYGNLGGSLDDAALLKKLFDSVPDRYINIVTGIEQLN